MIIGISYSQVLKRFITTVDIGYVCPIPPENSDGFKVWTYFQRINVALLGGRFGLLDNLLLGTGRASVSRLENVIGQIETVPG